MPETTREEALSRLLIELYSSDGLRTFLRGLSGGREVEQSTRWTLAHADACSEAVERLEGHRLIDKTFFNRLLGGAPKRAAEIAAIARRWGVELEAPRHRRVPPGYRRLVGVSAVVATVVAIALAIYWSRPPPRYAPPGPLYNEASLRANLVLLLVDRPEDVSPRWERYAALIEGLVAEKARAIAFADSFPDWQENGRTAVPPALNLALGRAHAEGIPILALEDGAPALPWCERGASAYCFDAGLVPSERWDAPTLHMKRCRDGRATLPHALVELARGSWTPGAGAVSCEGATEAKIRPHEVSTMWESELLTGVPYSGSDRRTGQLFAREGSIPVVSGKIVLVGEPRGRQSDGRHELNAEIDAWAALSIVESPG